VSVNRREFLQSSGAVVVYFSLTACESPVAPVPVSSSNFDNRITINADGSVQLFMGKVELGQGIGTALAQIAADEIGVTFEEVHLVTVDTDYSPDESYTFSSISIQQSGPLVRKAAAKAREYFEQQTGNAPPDALSVVGKSVPRIDIPGKVFGDECFIQDLRLDGMVHARVLRPPAERASITSIDSDPVLAMPGVLKIFATGISWASSLNAKARQERLLRL